MYPAQERDRSGLSALEIVNADGHRWDIRVEWPDGTVARPCMVAFQDIYSGMVLSWRVDRTMNSPEPVWPPCPILDRGRWRRALRDRIAVIVAAVREHASRLRFRTDPCPSHAPNPVGERDCRAQHDAMRNRYRFPLREDAP